MFRTPLPRTDVGHPEFGDLADALEDLLDPDVGILSTLEEVRREAGGPNFFHYRARSCNVGAFTVERNFRDSGGASDRREIAMAKAIGEAIERYCSAIFDLDALPLCSYDAADFRCTAPEAFALYLPKQYRREGFPWVPFRRDTRIRWTAARDLATGQEVHAPACRVYMPYTYYLGTGDAPIDQPISTGLACHMDWPRAAVNGVCEVIERDAIMITWQAKMAPAQIRVETLSEANYDLVQRLEHAAALVTLFDLTMDHGVPTVLATLRGAATTTPALVVAGSASLAPELAVRKALEELAHTRRYSQYIRSHAPRIVPDPPDYDSVTDQITHLNFYVDSKNLPHADFLFGSRKRVDFDELPNRATGSAMRDLEVLAARIAAVGEQVLVADITTADVENLGMKVVRAVVPGFHPLHMGHQNRALGGRRLREVPQKLGFVGIPGTASDNPAPHPYP
jgi:ribosomal protein S12 methylthiotransferase accessory factor